MYVNKTEPSKGHIWRSTVTSKSKCDIASYCFLGSFNPANINFNIYLGKSLDISPISRYSRSNCLILSPFLYQNVHPKPRRPQTRWLRSSPQPLNPNRGIALPRNRHNSNNPNSQRKLATLPHRPKAISTMADHSTARLGGWNMGRTAPNAPRNARPGEFRTMLLLPHHSRRSGRANGR